jgi:hydrogenase maturation factor HypF (carbamoyltransferase family)
MNILHLRYAVEVEKTGSISQAADVVLSGGVFQSRLLLGFTVDALKKDGFNVYTHCSP